MNLQAVRTAAAGRRVVVVLCLSVTAVWARELAAQSMAERLQKITDRGARISPATQRLLLQTLRVEDSAGYDRARDQLLQSAGLADPSAVAEVAARFSAREDSIRAVLRAGRPRLDLPRLDSAAGGPNQIMAAVRQTVALRTRNPVDAFADTLLRTALNEAAARLFRPAPAATWATLVQLKIPRPDSATAMDVAAGEQYLTATATASPAYAALSVAGRARLLKALQAAVAEAQHRGEQMGMDAAALARLGQHATASMSEVQTAVEGVTGTLQLVDELSRLRVDALIRTAIANDSLKKVIDDVRHRLTIGNAQTWADVRNDLALAQLLGTALRAPDPTLTLLRDADAMGRLARDINDFSALRARIETSEAGVLDATNQYLSSAQATLQSLGALSSRFHIPQAIIQKVNTALVVAQKAVAIGTAIASQNYAGAVFGAVDLVVGSLGGGPPPGPSIEELRFNAIMDQFDIVNRKLDAVIQLQESTLKYIAQIDLKLDSLADRIARDHRETLERFDRVDRQLLWVAAVVVAQDRQALLTCHDIAGVYGKGAYQDEANFVGSVAPRQCLDVLQRITVAGAQNQLAILPALSMKTADADLTASGGAAAVQSYKIQVTDPLLTYLAGWQSAHGFTTPAASAHVRSALASPLLGRPALRTVLLHLSDPSFASAFSNPQVPAAALKEPLRDSSVAELASAVLDLHPILAVLRDNGLVSEAAFFDPAQFATQGEPTGLRELQGSLALLDAAIAFQNLLGGDLIVTDMASHLGDPEVEAAVQHNAVLAMNVAREIVYSRVDAICAGPDPSTAAAGCGTLPDRYQHALDAASPDDLVRLLEESGSKLPAPLTGGGGSYRMTIAGLSVPLPTREEFRQQTYVTTPSLEQLWRVRDAVLDAMAGYSLRGGLPGSPVGALPANDQRRLSLLLAIE